MLHGAVKYTKLHSSNQNVEVALTGEEMKLKLLSVLLSFVIPAAAQQSSILYSGQELLNRFSTDRATALAYVAGVADAQSGVSICIPPGRVTLGQMGDMVRQTLERVPSERHLSADIYVQAALENRWPCARRNSGGGV